MLNKFSISLLVLGTVSANDFLRYLQGGQRGQKSYGENVSINFANTLGCGACIRGGYIYCIPGAEGSDPSSWAANTKAVCCRNSASCPETTNKAYLCSN